LAASAVTLPRIVEELLQPIPGEHPSGASLRYEGTYDRIAEARREDDPNLTQGVWKSALKQADWTEVEKLCIEALATRTKDLQIAAWLLEAWLHLHQFEGVKDGLDVLCELVERFWTDLHPQVVNGDLEFRIAPITWINEKLSIQLKLLPITSPHSEEVAAYGWSDWENACRTEVNDPKLRPAAVNASPAKLTPAEFHKSVMFTPTAFFAKVAGDVEVAMEACTQLESSLDRLCGKQTPSLRQFYGVLDSVHAYLMSTAPDRTRDPRDPEDSLASLALAQSAPDCRRPAEVADAVLTGPVLGSGSITSRDEAYRRLAEAAEYLSRLEPHSPAPYLVKRAILWGSMRLPELLREVVRNQTELSEIFRLLEIGNVTKE
jgi:type VI secretion system protein ImpA